MQETQFAKDVLEGLNSTPKRLSSKYFYDSRGDKLFQQIMHLDSYYLTRAELEIFTSQKERILNLIKPNGAFQLVELGAGDGFKTKVLLNYFVEKGVAFNYAPVDISGYVLDLLKVDLSNEFPDLVVEPHQGDYFQVLSSLGFKDNIRKVVFFLGSNIGNFQEELAKSFLKSMHDNLRKGDITMIGFDLKKDPQKILAAYNDPEGITSQFNLNLLGRINRELGGDFDLKEFLHYPIYDPFTGECRSYLISKKEQVVTISALNKTFEFGMWEPVFTEVSKKYSPHEIQHLAESTGFRLIENVYDEDRLFADSIWEVV